MSSIEISVARPEDKAAIANLMQLYVHDFSEQWAGTERGELQDDGRFADYPLDDYWHEPNRIPLLLRRDAHLIGFALINAHAHSGRALDRSMAEFFIVRKHRRDGVGTEAARRIFDLYPGWWEAAIARRNTAALAFWRKAINGHPHAVEIEESDASDDNWNGQIIRFRIVPPA